jgi:glycosyltransferase involved in cell wall biosynthesis
MISILILTCNEQDNLPVCLDSVAWADDVLVLDSFSTDRTLDIARSRGVRVLQNRFVNFAEQRNFGLAHGELKHNWVLHLDADERVTSELKEEMFATVASAKKDAYAMSSKIIFQGRWLRHAGLYPSYQVRLGRRDKLGFAQFGHGQRENLPPGRIGRLRESLVHENFSKGLEHWFEKHNRYSTAEARHCLDGHRESKLDWPALVGGDALRRRRLFKDISIRLPFRPALRFGYMYFAKLGILDGVPGFHYCRLLAIYEYMVTLKMKELQRRNRSS